MVVVNDWFRSWHGAPTDPKWLVIAKRAGVAPYAVSAFAWALFDHASQSSDRGCVSDFDFETYAELMGIDEALLQATYQAMEAKGIIADGRLAKWDKRQPRREDDSAERVREHRARKRQPDAPPPADVSAQNSEPVEPEPQPAARQSPHEITDQAKRISREVAIISGRDPDMPDDPRWFGSNPSPSVCVQAWLNRGFVEDIILESVRAQMTRKTGPPPGTITYFEAGIRDAHMSMTRPIRSERNAPSHKPQKTIMSVIDGMLSDVKRDGDRGGESPSRMLPDGRSKRP